jgi:hypothetical protein
MTLLFIGGVMNALWIAAIAALVLVEKTAGGGRLVSRAAGTGLIIAGVCVLVQWADIESGPSRIAGSLPSIRNPDIRIMRSGNWSDRAVGSLRLKLACR